MSRKISGLLTVSSAHSGKKRRHKFMVSSCIIYEESLPRDEKGLKKTGSENCVTTASYPNSVVAYIVFIEYFFGVSGFKSFLPFAIYYCLSRLFVFVFESLSRAAAYIFHIFVECTDFDIWKITFFFTVTHFTSHHVLTFNF